jgi:pyruvate formate lyase activating enzyme
MTDKKEALFYDILDNQIVRCNLCPHNCHLEPGYRGVCQVRKNVEGKLYANSYGLVSALRFDPVEKKPLYHYNPGKQILSVGGYGCNLRCIFCQNHTISQVCDVDLPKEKIYKPEDIISLYQRSNNACGIAFTYNEPVVNFEFVLETAILATQHNIPMVLVTNGYINTAAFEAILPHIAALNIDLKAFSDDFYRKYTGGGILPVLETLNLAVKAGKHVEITFLAISGLNDRLSEFNLMINWIAETLGKSVPFHISKYFPNYKLTNEPTSDDVLMQFYDIACKKLDFVYLGNVNEPEFSKTRCPNCYATLVERQGYKICLHELDAEGNCNNCGTDVNFVLHQ